jgi:predicted nucleotidyltransferase
LAVAARGEIWSADSTGESERLSIVATITLTDNAVLVRFRKALDEVYGARNIERVVLFGSRARGDARPDSDYDVAVFLNDPGELWDELGNLSRITTAILNDTGAVISAKPFTAGAWRELSPLMHEIRDDGLDL